MVKFAASLLLLVTSLAYVFAAGEWDYYDHGPLTWALQYPECSAQHQSPMPLYRAKSYLMPRYSTSYQISLKNYGAAINAVFSNNGHTVNLPLNYPNPATAPQVTIAGSDVDGTFVLSGIHFHWPSEHTIDDKRYDLEMHMVHKDPSNNRTLVLGYLFQECWFSGNGISILASKVPYLTHFGDSVAVQNFVPAAVMPANYKCNYFVYTGSLTTPPCTEDVTWLVHSYATCIAQDELKNFFYVMNEEDDSLSGNNRPIQFRNGRNLFYQSCYY